MVQPILIVDDDPDIVEAVQLILESVDYATKTLTKADEIYKTIAQFNPRMILLDVLMSGSDGRDICKKLKRDAKTKNIPIIMISAHPGAGKNALTCGANDFLAKPFDIDDLLEKVTRYLPKGL